MSMKNKLWCDLTTNEERSAWLLAGRGYETGVVSAAVQNDLSLAYAKLARYEAADAAPQPERKPLTVWFGAMPESNGKNNWSAILHNGNVFDGFTIARSEYTDQVRYEADMVRYLIGELPGRPDILKYDGKLKAAHGIIGDLE